MGLDMYLTIEIQNWSFNNDKKDNENFTTIKKLFPTLKSIKNVKSIRFDAMYWRKANQIHKWFVENVQDGEDDCREYETDAATLQNLIDNCKKVLDNRELAAVLLPVQSGFLFGPIEYDKHYFDVLERTAKELQHVIDECKDIHNLYFIYKSSW